MMHGLFQSFQSETKRFQAEKETERRSWVKKFLFFMFFSVFFLQVFRWATGGRCASSDRRLRASSAELVMGGVGGGFRRRAQCQDRSARLQGDRLRHQLGRAGGRRASSPLRDGFNSLIETCRLGPNSMCKWSVLGSRRPSPGVRGHRCWIRKGKNLCPRERPVFRFKNKNKEWRQLTCVYTVTVYSGDARWGVQCRLRLELLLMSHLFKKKKIPFPPA